MELIPYVIAYIAIGIFLIAVFGRVAMWLKMPIHVRWELYPVAHDAKRAHYGGSYLEDTDWWKKPREVSMIGELKVMIPEILFLVALKEHNPRMWWRSFPFHWGVYLVSAASMIMLGFGLLLHFSPNMATSGFGVLIRYLIMGMSYAGLCLGIIGAFGLLIERISDPDLRDFSSLADFFNLIFFIGAFGFALAYHLILDKDFAILLGFMQGLVTFKMTVIAGAPASILAFSVAVALLGLLVAYIPMTHMSHFIGKYFAYHAIRWNDAPNLRGGDQEAAIHQVLQYPVSWSAPHIKGDGKKTWADIATEDQK